MFKRDNEQPVKISFEEKKNNKEKRSLRERLSNIPLRRRVEAVLLAVVTVMASLSIDWSSLVARAEGTNEIASGWSISQVYSNVSAGTEDVTILNSANISVKKPASGISISYSWEVYQNLTNVLNPESGVLVGKGASKTIDFSDVSDFKVCTAELSSLDNKVALLGTETAAVVFTLTSNGGRITYKTSGNSGQTHYVKDGSGWTSNRPGTCVNFPDTPSGTADDLIKVDLSDNIPNSLAMKAGDTYTFSNISLSSKYKREIKLTETNSSGLISITENSETPTFAVKNSVDKGGIANLTLEGPGVTKKDIEVRVVNLALNGTGEGNSVFPYKYSDSGYTNGELITATCGDVNLLSDEKNFDITYSGPTTDRAPLNAGSYTLKFSGLGDYYGLYYEKEFSIAEKPLTDSMVADAEISVKNKRIRTITGVKDGDIDLESGQDFEAAIEKTSATVDGITYTIAITGVGNYTGTVKKDNVAELSEKTALDSVVGRIEFVDDGGIYGTATPKPQVRFFDKSDPAVDITDAFELEGNYEIVYNGTLRGTGEKVSGLESVKDAGSYSATIKGKGIYLGSSMDTDPTDPYIIEPIKLEDSTTTVTLKQSYYEEGISFDENRPEIASVTYHPTNGENWRLAAGTDYEVEDRDYRTAIGTGIVTVVGRGNYTGTAEAEYKVFPSLANATFALDDVTSGTMRKTEGANDWSYVWTYNGSFPYNVDEIEPKIEANVNSEILSLSAYGGEMTIDRKGDNTDVTTEGEKAYVVVVLPERYAYTKVRIEFDITAKPLDPNALGFKAGSISKDYNFGTPVTLSNSEYYVKDDGVTLSRGNDYTISYEDNINKGTAKIIATGKGNYTGTASAEFKIEAIDVNDKDLDISIGLQVLNSSGYAEVTDMGDVEIRVKGMEESPFTADDFTLDEYDHNNKAWLSATDGDQPQVKIKGKRNLKGEKLVYFQIKKKSLKGLTWRLTGIGTNIEGKLGDPGSTIDISAEKGFYLDYDPNLPSMVINLYDGSNQLSSIYDYVRPIILPSSGKNTFTVLGKGNYADENYTFTFEVRQLDISSSGCIFKQTDDGGVEALPGYTLTYNGIPLTLGYDYVTDLETVVNKEKEGSKYKLKDYTVTITGAGNYTGTRSEKIHIGKPFNSDNVFITMYGPTGTTTTVNGENRLTYFGDNDPYFILTSDKTDSSKKIEGPTYDGGAYNADTGSYKITFDSDPAERHKVGTTVKVTFTAKEGNGVWYNPGNEGITYYYKVMPGVGASVSDYPNLQSYLSIYTEYSEAIPGKDNKESFPTTVTNNLIPFSDFKFPYTTEGKDPEIYICYNPKIESGAYATQCSSVPAAPTGGEGFYAAPVKVKFNDSSLFTVSRGLISANYEDKKIIMTPVRTGWLGASQNPPKIEVDYTFTAAKLSDADITFTPSENYTYSGSQANVDFDVTIGKATKSLLTPRVDYQVLGYGAYSGDELTDEKIKTIKDVLNATTGNINTVLKDSGILLSQDKPESVGKYVLVIGPATNNNYTGYNIAKFNIVRSTITAALSDSNFSVTYGSAENAPESDNLVVTGENGESLTCGTDYVIGVPNITGPGDASVTIEGKGNYKGSQVITYRVVADISPASGSDYDFSKANLSLESHTSKSNCLGLTLKNDGDYPLIGSTDESFNPSTLTLEDKKGVKIPSNYLTTTVTGIDSEDNLTTVGKKMITVSGASGKPVTGNREYYVEVFADLSTAVLTLKVGGKEYPGNQIPYTGAAIAVVPDVTFRGIPVNINCYTIKEDNYTDIGSYTIEVTGTKNGAGAYYKGTAKKPYSIVYDLENDVEVVYTKDGTNWDTLAGKSLTYIGKSIVDHLDKQNWIKVRMTKTGADVPRSAYSLKHENDIEPGAGTASVTIDPVSTSSINRQTVYFSIGGTELEEGEKCSVTLIPNNPVYTYDGTAKEPEVSITYDQTKLTRGKDFEIEYLNNVNVPPENAEESQMPTVKIYGINGRYTGMIKKTFEIKKKELTDGDVSVDISDVPFGGKRSDNTRIVVEPATTVTVGGKTLKKGTDYELIYPDDMNADEYLRKEAGDEYIITVKGIGNYTGKVTDEHVVQLAGTLKGVSIDTSNVSPAYDGKNKKAKLLNGLVVKNGECILVKDTDYTIEDPGDIIDAKSYKITIIAVAGGDYDNGGEGSEESFTYTVTPRSVEENSGEFSLTLYDPVTGNSANSFAWNNNTQIKPKVRLADTRITEHDPSVGDIWTDVDSLKQSIMMNSFTVTYGENRFAGKDTGSVTLKASGNYTGSITRTFSIGTDIANATLSYDKTSAEYDGTPKKQDITVRYNNNTLEAGVAYESPIYTYTDSKGNVQETNSPTAVGSYVPVIKGKTDGGYYGELKGSPFRIIAQNKTGNIKIKFNGVGGEVDAADYVCHYNTKKQTPSINVYDTSGGTDVALTENVDYTVSYGNNTNAGSGYVYVALKGNYTGTAQEIFTIQPYDISNATLEFIEGENGIIKNVPEASFPYSPLFRLKGTDDNGEPFVIRYADSRQKQDLSIPDSSKVKKPGKGSLAVSGTGNNLYGTTNAYDYEVYGRLSEKNVIVTPPINTGVKKDPEVKVVFAGETLVLDTDYSLRIVPFDQTVSGGGNVIVEGLGYFTGSVYTKYGEASDVSSLTLRGFSQQYIYSGVFAGPQESAIYAVDKDGNTVISADKLECTFTSDKDNAACITANATVTITTKATLEDGTVQDGPKATYKIVPRNINSCDIMRLENDIYTGKALKPPVAVSFRRKEYTFGSTGGIAEEKVLDVITLKEGTDYSLSYKNNVYPGTADITVTGKGNYTGTRLFHFVINVISMGSVSAKRTADGIVVSWAARPYVAGYRVLYDTDKLTGVSTTGTTVTLKDALPTRVGVQPYILGSGKTPIYGAAKYIDVS